MAENSDMATFWTCAQTHPRGETLALRNLRRQDYTAFFPFFLVAGRWNRSVVQPVFPGYVFVQLDDDMTWGPINSTMGIRRLLTVGGDDDEDYRKPARIPFIAELRQLRLRRPGTEDLGEPDAPIPIGTTVLIRRGPFTGRRALVGMSWPERVQLLVECFGGRQMPVTFAVGDVNRDDLAPTPLIA